MPSSTPMPCSTLPLLAAILDGSSEPALLVSGTSGDVLHRNAAARELFGVADDDNDGQQTGDDNDDGDATTVVELLSLLTIPGLGPTWEAAAAALGGSDDGEQKSDRSYDATLAKSGDGGGGGGTGTVAVTLRLSALGPSCGCCGSSYLGAYLRPVSNAAVEGSGGGGEMHRLKRIRAAVDAAFDPVLTINRHGTILMVNTAALTKFGYTYSEFMGANISLICGGGHGPKHDAYLKRYLATGERRIIGIEREVPARRKDGTEFPVRLGISLAECEGEKIFSGFIRDLTREKEHDRALEHKTELVQGMIDASFDPMFQTDSKGIIQVVNRAAVALFGYTKEEFLDHMNVSTICGGVHGPRHDEYLARYLRTGERRIIGRKREVTARRKDGTEIPIELGISEVKDENTGESVFCGYIRDLTRQKMDKERIKQNEAMIQDKFFSSSGGTGGMDDGVGDGDGCVVQSAASAASAASGVSRKGRPRRIRGQPSM